MDIRVCKITVEGAAEEATLMNDKEGPTQHITCVVLNFCSNICSNICKPLTDTLATGIVSDLFYLPLTGICHYRMYYRPINSSLKKCFFFVMNF